jgi:predicted ATP-dependent Lon-type protease
MKSAKWGEQRELTETFWTEDRRTCRSGFPLTLLKRLRERLRKIGGVEAIRAEASAFSDTKWPESDPGRFGSDASDTSLAPASK